MESNKAKALLTACAELIRQDENPPYMSKKEAEEFADEIIEFTNTDL